MKIIKISNGMIEGELSNDISALWLGFRDEIQKYMPYWQDDISDGALNNVDFATGTGDGFRYARAVIDVYNKWQDWKKSSPANVKAELARLEAAVAASSSSSSSSFSSSSSSSSSSSGSAAALPTFEKGKFYDGRFFGAICKVIELKDGNVTMVSKNKSFVLPIKRDSDGEYVVKSWGDNSWGGKTEVKIYAKNQKTPRPAYGETPEVHSLALREFVPGSEVTFPGVVEVSSSSSSSSSSGAAAPAVATYKVGDWVKTSENAPAAQITYMTMISANTPSTNRYEVGQGKWYYAKQLTPAAAPAAAAPSSSSAGAAKRKSPGASSKKKKRRLKPRPNSDSESDDDDDLQELLRRTNKKRKKTSSASSSSGAAAASSSAAAPAKYEFVVGQRYYPNQNNVVIRRQYDTEFIKKPIKYTDPNTTDSWVLASIDGEMATFKHVTRNQTFKTPTAPMRSGRIGAPNVHEVYVSHHFGVVLNANKYGTFSGSSSSSGAAASGPASGASSSSSSSAAGAPTSSPCNPPPPPEVGDTGSVQTTTTPDNIYERTFGLTKNQCEVVPYMFHLLSDERQQQIAPDSANIPRMSRNGPLTSALLNTYKRILLTPVNTVINKQKIKGMANIDQMRMLSDSLHVYSVDVHFGNAYILGGFLDCPGAEHSVCTCGQQHLHYVFIVGARRSVMRSSHKSKRYLNLGSVCITFLDSKNLGTSRSHLDKSLREAQTKHRQMKKPATRKQLSYIDGRLADRDTSTISADTQYLVSKYNAMKTKPKWTAKDFNMHEASKLIDTLKSLPRKAGGAGASSSSAVRAWYHHPASAPQKNWIRKLIASKPLAEVCAACNLDCDVVGSHDQLIGHLTKGQASCIIRKFRPAPRYMTYTFN